MTTKKPVKKRVLKPAVKKPVEIKATSEEQFIIDKVADMLSNDYSVKLNCADRHKMCKPGEDLLAYIRANNPHELVGMKSGSQALAFGIK